MFLKLNVILFIACCGIHGVSFSQKLGCPLRLYTFLEAAPTDWTSDPALGVFLKSKTDSVFSIFRGKVVRVESRGIMCSVVIKSGNGFTVIYNFSGSPQIKQADMISIGQNIGTIRNKHHAEGYLLNLILSKYGKVLSKEAVKKYLGNCSE